MSNWFRCGGGNGATITIDGVEVEEDLNLEFQYFQNMKEVCNLPYFAYTYPSIVAYKGDIYFLGGIDKYTDLAIATVYRLRNGVLTKIDDMPYANYRASAIVYNDEIHIFGGTEKKYTDKKLRKHYAFNGETWHEVSTLPCDYIELYDNIHEYYGFFVEDGKLNVGGYKYITETKTTVTYRYYYEPNTGWTKITDSRFNLLPKMIKIGDEMYGISCNCGVKKLVDGVWIGKKSFSNMSESTNFIKKAILQLKDCIYAFGTVLCGSSDGYYYNMNLQCFDGTDVSQIHESNTLATTDAVLLNDKIFAICHYYASESYSKIYTTNIPLYKKPED